MSEPVPSARQKRRQPRPQADPRYKLRGRAELLIRESTGKAARLPEADMQKLVHELQVHQMELEIQNEELRQTRLELESARDRYSTLYDFAPVGYLTLDHEGVIREANLTAATMLGANRTNLAGKKLAMFVAKPDRDIFHRHRQKVAMTGTTEMCELRLQRGGERTFTAELSSILVPTDPALRNEHLVILSDITERRRAGEERARLAAIVDSSNDAIVGRNLAGIITNWNAGAERMLGYSAAEITGRPYAILVPTDQRAAMDALAQRILKGEQTEHYESVRIAKDGRRVSVSGTIAPIRDGAGNIVGISTISRDFTRQKQAEEALRQSERNLAEFFAESPLGLMWIGPRGRILRVNRAQLELVGRDYAEVFGHNISQLHADREVAEDVLNRLGRGETLSNYRTRLRHKNGTPIHVLIDANGMWENEQLVHTRWFVRDITRRVELEREILNVSEREQGRLGRDLHDDLGQQLAGMEFLAQTLVGRLTKLSQPAAAQAREIARMAQRTMVRTRELARGLSPIGVETEGLMVALRELAVRTKKVFRVECRFRCRKPVFVHDHEVGIHLYRIAQEAVNNAIKHGKARRIEIGLALNGDCIMLAVSDNGIGMPKKSPKKNGLGLRVMQYRAGVIDASLVVQRKMDGGTTFVCTVREQSARRAVRKT